VRREGLVRVEQCVKNYIENNPIGNQQDLHLLQVDRMTGIEYSVAAITWSPRLSGSPA